MFAPAFGHGQTQKHGEKDLQSRAMKRKRRSSRKAHQADLFPGALEEDIGTNSLARSKDRSNVKQTQSEDAEDDEDSPSNYDDEQLSESPKSAPGRMSKSSSVRSQHLAVLMAMLHRCLLAGDYVRAGRAWGMLLRAESLGHHLDVRSHGRWGIGAEILLFRDAQLLQQQPPVVEEQEMKEDYFAGDGGRLSAKSHSALGYEGFRKAKQYYERLILQYPYRKIMPHAVSSLDFYPAMFGLWIYAVQSSHKDMMSVSAENGSAAASCQPWTDIQTQINHNTFQRVSDIATNLDELLVSPPYSDQSRFWRLRGMLALWMADLLSEDQTPNIIFDKQNTSTSDGPFSVHAIEEQHQPGQEFWRQQRLNAERRAQEAFQNASRLVGVPSV